MNRFVSSILALGAGAVLAHGGSSTDIAASFVSSGAQEILDQHCVKCHGPLEHKGGLELDAIEAVLRGNRDGVVLIPGKPSASKLITVLSADADPHMPPKKQLAETEIARLRQWVASLTAEQVARLNGKAGETPAGHTLDPRKIPVEPTAAIDTLLAAGWRQRKVRPTPLCDDATFVRRIHLDLAGRIPTPEEAEAFVRDADRSKRSKLADKLLAGDEYARRFREVWDAILLGRHSGRREQRRQENGWFSFLEDAFSKNRPWNEVVRDIILARPSAPENKGAIWFLYERRNEHQQIAEAIAPVIYGTRIDCAQCHDHPLSREIKQAHYWGLVAAFNRSKNVEEGTPAVGETAIGGFINFTNLKKQSQPALLSFLNGASIAENRPAPDAKEEDVPEGYIDPSAKVKVPKVSRRELLARAVTENNPLLARAFVNYTWELLLGRGIVHPVDEINSKHPASHPELLEWLAKDFSAHHYDVRRLVRAIVLSRGYQLSLDLRPKPAEPEAFAAALEKPLLAETMARSVRIASGRSPEDPALRKVFVESFTDVLPRVNRTTIQQSMLLANNESFAALFKMEAGSSSERLGQLPKAEDQVREAFRLTLNRKPDRQELEAGVSFLKAANSSSTNRIGDLLWALTAGPEFLTNH
jgi:mono/diheme cytochrome c family protein